MTRECDLFSHGFPQVKILLKSKTIMTTKDKLNLLAAIGTVEKAKATISVLSESMTEHTVIGTHQSIVVEMIEDMLIDAIAIFDKVSKTDL